MTEFATIARPYAEAAFSVAKKSDVQHWLTMLLSFATILLNSDIHEVVQNPEVPPEKLLDLLIDLTFGNCSISSSDQTANRHDNRDASLANMKHSDKDDAVKKDNEQDDALLAQQKRFITMLVESKRLSLVSEIVRQFQKLMDEDQKIANADIRTAFTISEEELKELLVKLEKKFSRRLRPQITIDPTLIGGVCVTVGDQILDASVKGQLAKMKTDLTI